jgi:hypothetical protein
VRIDVIAAKDQTPTITLDGKPISRGRNLRWTDSLDLPYTLVYLDGERQYDIEVWVNGTLTGRVPSRSDAVDAAYGAHENGTPLRRDASGGALQNPAEMSVADRLKAIRAQINASPGQLARLEWDGLARTLAVHQRNTDEFISLLQAMGADEMVALEMFQNVRPPLVRDELLGQVDQRMHNFVASAGALVDHTRRLFDDYPGTNLRAEYEKRKDVLAAKPVVGFVKDLRNYLLHRKIPVIGHTVSLGAQMTEPKTTMLVSVEYLRQWDGWKGAAKVYLASAGESIQLSSVPEEYAAELTDLYDWVFKQFHGMHRADIHALDALLSEHDWILSGGREGRPRPTTGPSA